jgi:hypothetical protein
MEADPPSGLGVGRGGLPVQQQDEAGALPQVGGGGAGAGKAAGFGEEIVGEAGAVGWSGSGHGRTCGYGRRGESAFTLPGDRWAATLQLIVKRTS